MRWSAECPAGCLSFARDNRQDSARALLLAADWG